MTKIPDLLILGTDTGVGKSVVSLLVMQLLYGKGYCPFYVKPFQTGCRDAYDSESDAAFVYSHTPSLQDSDPAQSVICCYPNPKAPYFAARDAGEHIDLDEVVRQIVQHRKTHHPLVVEAAGGLMVPLTEDHMVVDLVERLAFRPLLVARAGLGTINHTLLSIEALRRKGVMPIGVVFVADDGPTQDLQLVAENMAAVEAYGRMKVAGVIPRIEDFTAPSPTAYAPLQQLLFPTNPAGASQPPT